MDWLAKISANLQEAVAHYRRVRDDARYCKWPRLLYFTLLTKNAFATGAPPRTPLGSLGLQRSPDQQLDLEGRFGGDGDG